MIINRSDAIQVFQFEGNVNTSIPSGTNGTVTGTEQYASGVSGQAFDFDGASFVDSGVNFSGTGDFTILLRGDITSEDGNVRRYVSNLSSTNGFFFLYNGGSGVYFFRVRGSSGNIDLSIADSNFSEDPYAFMLYFKSSTEIGIKAFDSNGVFQTFTTAHGDATWVNSANNIHIGAKSDDSQWMDGSIDDVVVIDGAVLTDEDFYRYYMGFGITDL